MAVRSDARIGARRHAWRVARQRCSFHASRPGSPVALNDTWDGYQASRDRVFEFSSRKKMRDVAILRR